MAILRWAQVLALTVVGAAIATPAPPRADDEKDKPAATAPDNTKANKHAEPTADQAGNELSDREIMRRIRRDVVKDKNLSTYAHNVKIVANGGRVTLKGPVRSEDEKSTVEAMAVKVAGEGNVVNEITVKPE
jgi:osmotically-inducible protein OsmY